MDILKGINATIAFLTEMGMYASYGIWGFTVGHTPITRWVCALIPPISTAIVWGIFAAPNASRRLERPWIYIFEVVLLVAAAALLYKSGHRSWAITLGTLSVASQLLAFFFKQ